MFKEKVLSVKHYTDRMFSFTTTRSPTFRFKNGEFAMIGLDAEPRPIFRAYSIVSTNYDDYLEFFSIKVPDGPLTSRLQHIRPGDEILIKPKTTGSLVTDYLIPKPGLVMLATGTGIAPFVSIARDPATYERFEAVYLFHTVRESAELGYLDSMRELEKEYAESMMPFKYVETVTRQPYCRQGRFWDHLNDYFPYGLQKEAHGVMVCGSPELNKQCREMFTGMGWLEGNTGEMGDFMLERAFAD